MTRFDVPVILLPEYVQLNARRHAGKAALVFEDAVVTWAELGREVRRVANALVGLGVKRGDKVGILVDNSDAAIFAYFGTLECGAAVAALPTIVTADSLAAMIDDCEAPVLIVSEAYFERVETILPRLRRSAAPALIAIGAERGGWQSFDVWRGQASAAGLAVINEPDDDASLIYSSGTTGVPKGIALTHYCRLNHAYLISVEQKFSADAVVLVTTALHSNTAWTLLLCAFLTGATTVLMRKFEPDAWCRLVAQHLVTHTLMVPAQYQAILDHPEVAARDLDSLQTLATVGSAMRESVKRALLARFPCGYYEVYGLTEGFATLVRPEDLPAKISSVGRPMMGNDIRIIDDRGGELLVGEPGEIVGYSPILMKGYHKNPEETEAMTWREPRTGRTFLCSGDIGHFDEDGFLYLVDRKRDMIVSGGYNVFPADIERVLGEHPAVQDLCVIGVPHERWGETPLALVVLKANQAPSADTLRTWANERLGRHQRISAVEYRTELSRNPAGKILKRELRAPYWPDLAPGGDAMPANPPE